ncbi:MAG: class I SAM-dependent methyltransferase [Flavobacteriaceae bacterium]|jgi:2-polyprenyl-3-methyl-5-hydroxy-6-metoxy-1,4-benzoquinol methylase|nr:class I SAM-dependent methyltransferase [Flavobacteriaceae bacterium]
MHCTLCQSLLENKIDESYYICTTCYAYVKDNQLYYTKEKEKQHYECHNNDINDLGYQKFTSPITDTILERCTPTMIGLDYGCGKGPVITHQIKSKGYQVNLYDPYFHPDLSYLDTNYDYIFSCEVFEHFYHPDIEIKKLTSLLKTGGLLLIKTHLFTEQTDFKNWYYRKDETHVFIYTFKTFEYIAHTYGYKIDTLTERLIILQKQ